MISEPLNLNRKTLEDNLVYVYDIFRETFIDNRPTFQNKFIYFEYSKRSKGITYHFPERFMHLVSLEDNSKVDVLPCTNDIASSTCNNLCDFKNAHSLFVPLKRNDCLYRMARIHWIPEIIVLANKNDFRVKIWTQKQRNRKRKIIENTFLRFQENAIDYVIILAPSKKNGRVSHYILKTAFPVFFKRTKKQYDQMYEKYKYARKTQ